MKFATALSRYGSTEGHDHRYQHTEDGLDCHYKQEDGRPCYQEVVRRFLGGLRPSVSTGIAFPKTAMKPPRPGQEGAGVVHCFVQSPEGNFERLAYWTAGLQILPHSLYVKLLWYTF